ncbi:hypothetical protein ACOME3_002612 [Neoechinorhynchus agilis]
MRYTSFRYMLRRRFVLFIERFMYNPHRSQRKPANYPDDFVIPDESTDNRSKRFSIATVSEKSFEHRDTLLNEHHVTIHSRCTCMSSRHNNLLRIFYMWTIKNFKAYHHYPDEIVALKSGIFCPIEPQQNFGELEASAPLRSMDWRIICSPVKKCGDTQHYWELRLVLEDGMKPVRAKAQFYIERYGHTKIKVDGDTNFKAYYPGVTSDIALKKPLASVPNRDLFCSMDTLGRVRICIKMAIHEDLEY